MQNLLEELKDLFSKDQRFVIEGNLLKNKIVECALHLDPGLIALLLQHPAIKKYFFTQVGEVLIFDKIKFQKFVSSKQFLPDSYTAFKNKIGLVSGDEYISDSKDVVLAWAYKDCVLEGGQTKEDQKRNEVFWNETLAPDEIDRLLSPKVFTNFKRFMKNGEKEVTGLSGNENYIMKGNNLLVLHSLAKMKSIKGKVKLIYIDPPYNTGNDGFQYNDSFNHSTWLTFMKNRLEIAWELLSNDGAFFIQVDDNEFAYLKVLCDEIFGRDNFRENIILKSSTESGVNAINVKRGERLFKVKENILFYSKSTSYRFKPFYTKTDYNNNYKYEVKKNNDGSYSVKDIYKEFEKKRIQESQTSRLTDRDKDIIRLDFVKYALDNPDNIYSLEKNIKKAGDKFKQFVEQNKKKGIVEEYTNSSNEIVLVYDGGSFVPLKERVVSENGKNYFGVLASDLWVDIGTTASGEGGVSFGNGKKPEKLLRRIMEMTTNVDDLVLDFHLGSGTTAAVAHKLKRRYIGIEQLDYGENDSVERIKKVIQGDKTGISRSVDWKGGGEFIYCELKKINQVFVDEILSAKDIHSLKGLYSRILQSNFISYHISEDLEINELVNTDIESIKKILMSLIDLNILYLSFSDMKDAEYKISDKEIVLNQKLYN